MGNKIDIVVGDKPSIDIEVMRRKSVFVEVNGIGIGGTTNHNELSNRDLLDQHSIEAITGLGEELNDINLSQLGMDGRMTAAETEMFQLRTVAMPLKADLDSTTKTVLPSQIAPLQGLQTGADCSNALYSSTASGLLFAGSKTVEVFFKIKQSPTRTSEIVCDMTGDASNIRIDVIGGNILRCYCGGVFVNVKGANDASYHVVICFDAANNTGTLFVNGSHIQTITSAMGMPKYMHISGYGTLYNQRFVGVVSKCRVFNYALSDAECLSLWNNGDPLNYMLPNYIKILSPAVDFASRNLKMEKCTLKDNKNYVNEGSLGYFAEAYRGMPDIIPNGLMKITYDIDVYADNTMGVTYNGKKCMPSVNLVHGGNKGILYLNSFGGNGDMIYLDFRTLPYLLDGVIINNITIERVGCVAEYIPCGLLSDKWRDTSGNGNDLAAVGTPKLVYQRPAYVTVDRWMAMFTSIGAVWNADTGFYELNRLTDITEQQMINIYNYGRVILSGCQETAVMGCTSSMNRTNWGISSAYGIWCNTPNLQEAFRYNRVIETVLIPYWGNQNEAILTKNLRYTFNGCDKMRTIISVIDVSSCNYWYLLGAFNNCYALEEVNITKLSADISFGESSKLIRDSILYLINNAINTTPITLTLHADAAARLTTEDIALASSKNITIA